jgi:NADPH-dependent glutamate synthase beta subunit-like oxidoreductase
MLRYAIPTYRLPETALAGDLDWIIATGITIKTKSKLGRDFSLATLKSDGFKAIFLALGAQLSKKISLPGLDGPDVFWGIDFLKEVRTGKIAPLSGRKVLVIGGGNVAIDVALTARRLGAREVQLACLEDEPEMPAHKWEIDQARQEGIILSCGWGPNEITRDENQRVRGMRFVKCTAVFDEKHCFNPSFDNTVSRFIETSLIILAIGQSPDSSFLSAEGGLKLSPAGTIEVNNEMLQSSIPGVFAGGEIVHNPGSVVEAVADGKKAASAIDKYLGGNGNILSRITNNEQRTTARFGCDEGFADWRREKVPARPPAERINDFKPIETGYEPAQAIREARRCLQCDIRLQIAPPIFPPQKEKYLPFIKENIHNIPDKEGVYQLLDETKGIILIKGVANLRSALSESIEQAPLNSEARYFLFELDPFYTKRESELIQHHLAKYGKMPKHNDELADLF